MEFSASLLDLVTRFAIKKGISKKEAVRRITADWFKESKNIRKLAPSCTLKEIQFERNTLTVAAAALRADKVEVPAL